MKTSSVNNTINSRNNQYYSKTNFRGGLTNALVKLDAAMKNSRAIQFTVEDMCGTNFPRSYKGLTAGYKYSHKLNIKAFLQEATREFLTGPTMCLVPFFIISSCKKSTGGTSNMHLENINNLSGMLMQQKDGVKGNEEVVNEFLKSVSSDVLNSSVGKDVDSDSINALASKLKEYVSAISADKPLKADKKRALANVQETFQNILKSSADDYSKTDFLTASYTKFNSKGEKLSGVLGSTSSSNYFEYVGNFIKDFVSKNSSEEKIKLNSDVTRMYRNSWLGKRAVIIACMFFITGVLMSLIPKLYTALSGKTNPNAVAIYNEADKQKTEGGNK